MQCPFCGADSRVLDSRGGQDQVRRRRECLSCQRRFTTYEKLAESEIVVVKRGGKQAPFDRERLERVAMRVARGRRLAPESLRALVRGLEAELVDAGARTVTSAQLADRLYARLQALDAVAADRFAANYRQDDGSIRFADDEPSPQLDLLAGVAGDTAADTAADTGAQAAASAPAPRRRGRPRKLA